MSFTDEVKHELIRYKNKNKQAQKAELAALLRLTGSINIADKKMAVKLKLRYGDLARMIFSWLKEEYQLEVEIRVFKPGKLEKNQTYLLYISPQDKLINLLKELGIWSSENSIDFSISDEFLVAGETGQAYLRGMFIGGGSINSPRSEYHLEFRCDYQSQARDLIELLEIFSLTGKMIEHQDKYMVYLKKYAEIVNLLNLIGAQKAQLKFEHASIIKEVKSNVNRKINFETANLDKTIEAAIDQLEDIELVATRRGLDNIPDSLREIARLRRQYPYASLKELGEKLNPPLSKSGVNHRFRRLRKIAKNIRRGQ